MKQFPTILALDLGTKTGWAVHAGYRDIRRSMKVNYEPIVLSRTHGWVDFSNKRFEGGGMRYLRFMKWLDEMRDTLVKIDEVYFEEVRRHMGVDAAHAYGGFLGMLTGWCEKNCIPYQGIPVKTIKKHITGKGNASKQMVIDAVNARGYVVTNDNEADAVALLLHVRER